MTTPTAELSNDELVRLWAGLGVAGTSDTITATIVPQSVNRPTRAGEELSLLPAMPSGEIEVTGPLAEGGMAVVHLAHQRGLEREVAVKVLRGEISSPETRSRLLREARLTGALEHPNIIPVHTIGQAADGEPMLVMKRIDGISWRQFIDHPDDRAEAFTGETAREKNLDILMQVAKAVHYAHTRGVVHRDLKPENIMIGRFGDVYVLDWGIAVRLDEGELHDAQVAGTPGYMAPEMVGGGRNPITVRTDVFLLGAVLHELLTGEPPHQGRTVQAAMFRAFRAEPAVYDPEIPHDLAEICHRAMARDPADRFPDAEAFRLAVARHLRNLGSIAVAREAEQRLGRLVECLAAQTRESARIYRHYGAARFGFEHALQMWPGNDAARRGLQTTLERMITFELDADHPAAAEALYAELPEPAPALQNQLARAHAEATARALELAALRAMERDLAPEVGARTRVRVAIGLGAALGAMAMVAGVLTRHVAHGPLGPAWYLPHSLLLITVAGLFLYRGRRALAASQINRRIVAMTMLTLVSGFAFRAVLAVSGVEFLSALPLEFVLYASGIALMSVATHGRIALAALPVLMGAIAMVLSPTLVTEIAGATVFAALATMAAIWQRDVGR
ncbi:MAG: serine/threonine-protein kinase [bacterium]